MDSFPVSNRKFAEAGHGTERVPPSILLQFQLCRSGKMGAKRRSVFPAQAALRSSNSNASSLKVVHASMPIPRSPIGALFSLDPPGLKSARRPKGGQKKGPSSGIGTFPAQQRAGACNPARCGCDDVDDSLTAIRRPWRVASSRLCRVNAAGVRCDATTPLPLHLSHDRLDIGE